MDTDLYDDLEKPDAISITAYGVWHNGGNSYTIAGGYSDTGDPGGNGLDHGYLVDWDSVTKVASNWTDYNYKNLSDSDYITHFEGITSDGSGGYNLVADSALSSFSDNFILAAFINVKRISGLGSAFGKAIWTDLVSPYSRVMSGNTVYLRNALGIYISEGITSSYVATLPD
jgi:hypothetical protein